MTLLSPRHCDCERHCEQREAKAEQEAKGLGFKKNGARIEIQPRFKIQYPMKNQYNTKAVFPLLQYHFWGIYPRFRGLVKNKEKFCRIKKESIFALQNTK